MAVRQQVEAWSARPGYRVLLRQDGPLGRPLLWVPLVPGGPRVNEASEQAVTYSNLTVNTGLATASGGFYDFNGTNSAVTFTNPRDPLTPTSTLASTTPVTLTWLQRYDTQSNSYPFVWSIYFSSITSFVCFQAPSDGSYHFVAGVAGSNTPSFSSGHGAPVVGRVNRYVLTAANGLGATSGFVMWRDGVRFTSPGTIATADGLTGSSKIGGRSSDSTFNWSGVIADAGIFAGIASDAAIEQFFDRPYDGLYQPRRTAVPVSAGGTPRSETASLSVAVQQARNATSSVAAAIQAGRTASASVAAAVQLGRTATASAAAAVQAPRTATASVATAVQDAHTASAALAAAVQRGVTATASIAAALQAARTATASASAAVQESHTATASVTAYVQAGQTVSASLSAAVQAARTAQASVAAAVQAPHTAQASLATAIAEARSVTTSLAAAVQQARSTSASISAQIQAGTTVVAQINAAILEARTASASIAAAVAVARSASASLAAAVAVSATLTAAIQAAVLRARSATAAVAAYISTPGDHTIAPRLYLVDAQDRAYLIDPEDRTYIVPASDRSSAA